MATPQEKHSVYHGLVKQNQIHRLGETTELSVEEIHRHDQVFLVVHSLFIQHRPRLHKFLVPGTN